MTTRNVRCEESARRPLTAGLAVPFSRLVRSRRWVVLAALASGLLATPASARSLRVPRDYPTIQTAVDAALAGDEIVVGKGRFCGATLDKALTLTARRGESIIIGCASGPLYPGSVLRIGFFLPGVAGTGPASGSTIRGFVFDGEGVSNSNLAPLAFGVLARFNDHVTVEDNEFRGTVQAITNTAGDHWSIAGNRIEHLSLFDCSGSQCSGGDGIVIQRASANLAGPGGFADPTNRPEANAVVDNDIEGAAPAGFDLFGMDGIVVFGADGTAVVKNRTRITAGVTSTDVLAIGVLVTNVCCGDPTEVIPGSRYTSVILNDDQHSQFGVVIEGDANTLGLVVFGNRGRSLFEGTSPAAQATRRAVVARQNHRRFE